VTQDASIQHTVSFTLVHPAGSAAEREFLDAARATLAGVPGVRDFTVNRQVSPKSGFAFQFAMRFEDEDAYRAYDAHPDHVDFVATRWVPEVDVFQELDFRAL
jgi:hypothetical protein